jgi:hypothetical protein
MVASLLSASGCDEVARRLVAGGAILTLPGAPLIRELVGEWRWLDERSVFVFPAFGDKPSDGRLLEFDEVQRQSFGVCFLNRGVIGGLLTSIERAGVEDPSDYSVAWKLWQEVWPLRRTLIEHAAELAGRRHPAPPTGRRAGSRQPAEASL